MYRFDDEVAQLFDEQSRAHLELEVAIAIGNTCVEQLKLSKICMHKIKNQKSEKEEENFYETLLKDRENAYAERVADNMRIAVVESLGKNSDRFFFAFKYYYKERKLILTIWTWI